MKAGRLFALAAVCLLASGCYRQVVNTGRAPSPTVISKPWTATWAWGLVAAAPIDVTQQCPGGIATVTTQLTVPNWLASAVTFGIYSPRSVTVTCAQGNASLGLRELHVARNAPLSERHAAFTEAMEISERTSEPVAIRF
jgi:hypothetical protein